MYLIVLLPQNLLRTVQPSAFSSCSYFSLNWWKKSEGQTQTAGVVNQKRAAEASGLWELGACSCRLQVGKNKSEVNGCFAPNSCLSGREKKNENTFFWSSNHCVRLAFWHCPDLENYSKGKFRPWGWKDKGPQVNTPVVSFLLKRSGGMNNGSHLDELFSIVSLPLMQWGILLVSLTLCENLNYLSFLTFYVE